MDFSLTEEQTLIQDMARQFSDSELAPNAEKWEAALASLGISPSFLSAAGGTA